ncbi:M28 family peptidase [Neolewinella litorea]|uniref:M28 family peptidase n=1 Tax=Neolewinella litorea TaxID=2562452 RepID=A0A4S4NMG7_9BACT|nr:M28 family peptidase [Neolewinella litorea]THH41116.1 M28 family peptidase [Neolewinella litorea]
MKNTLFLLLIASLGLLAQGGKPGAVDRSLPEFSFDRLELAGQLYFLSSDYLQGRRTGSVGNEIAAEFIAAQLKAYGYEPINAADSSYFQRVPLRMVNAPTRAALDINGSSYTNGDDLLVIRGPEAEATAQVVYANFGWVDPAADHDDYANLDVKGKIVITRAGLPGDQSQQAVFRGMEEKAAMAAAAGAVGIFELFTLPFPWESFKRYLGGERITMTEEGSEATIPYGFIRLPAERVNELQSATGGLRGSLASTGMRTTGLGSRNVGGILRGSNPALADEYLLMTAHFDHVGVGRQGGGAYTAEDSIFNGARDNAFGTVSLLAAARAFAQEPPERSIIVLAVTGEEMGLLGSKYYADNPLVPLEQTIFNFNTDGAGYNDTSAISLIGMGRTGIDEQIETAAAAFGSSVIANPAPEQGLFDRSDNVNFAVKGVPALTFSPGMTGFDDAIARYYHQVTDNPETVDVDYLKRYCQIYTLAVRLIANRPSAPFWKEGDKYESAGKALYGNRK